MRRCYPIHGKIPSESTKAPVVLMRDDCWRGRSSIGLLAGLVWLSSSSSRLVAGCAQRQTQEDDVHQQTAFGVQSSEVQDTTGAAANTFASSMLYDEATDRIYVTGATYGHFFAPGSQNDNPPSSSCFVGILQLPSRVGDTEPIWVRRVRLGMTGVPGACSSITLSNTDKDLMQRRMFLTGQSAATSRSIAPFGSNTDGPGRTIYGMILELTWYAQVQGGYLIDTNPVQYPVAVLSTIGSDELLVATMISDSPSINPLYEQYNKSLGIKEANQPDLTINGGFRPASIGTNFSLLLQRLRQQSHTESQSEYFTQTSSNALNEVQQSYIQSWGVKLDAGDNLSIQMSSLLLVSNNTLVVAGTTHGAEQAMSEKLPSDTATNGLLMVVDGNTGEIMRSSRQFLDSNNSVRISGLCGPANTTGQAVDHFYIVGTSRGNTTTGTGLMKAFIQRISVEGLESEWTFQLGGISNETTALRVPQIHGQSCAVTSDGRFLYMAGTAKDGAAISLDGTTAATVAAGGDDIFVVQLRSDTGEFVYVNQLGSHQDDNLADGTGLVSDKNGNAILLGNTRGPLLRTKIPTALGEWSSDLFLISIDRDTGEHVSVGYVVDQNVTETPSPQPLRSSDSELEVNNSYVNTEGRSSSGNANSSQSELRPPLSTDHRVPVGGTDDGTMTDRKEIAYVVSILMIANLAMAGLILTVCIRRREVRKSKEINELLNAAKLQDNTTIKPSKAGGCNVTFIDDYDKTRLMSGTGSLRSNYLEPADTGQIFERHLPWSEVPDDFDTASFASGVTLRPDSAGSQSTRREPRICLQPKDEMSCFLSTFRQRDTNEHHDDPSCLVDSERNEHFNTTARRRLDPLMFPDHSVNELRISGPGGSRSDSLDPVRHSGYGLT